MDRVALEACDGMDFLPFLLFFRSLFMCALYGFFSLPCRHGGLAL